MRRVQAIFVSMFFVFAVAAGLGQGANRMTADTFKGLELRGLGPTLSTGRVADVEVDPNNPTRYFVASAVGGLWKSDNRGDTWHSVFDNGGSFNMCCVVIDPKNSDIVWLGTGENSNPRSATYGDGVYKSTDGGENFTRVGLETSEHIGNIKIDPRNSDVVYVAAQGPLWSAGGDRGVFKTTDGGKTWKAVLTVSADTGANEVVIDPNNPDVLYASMWQRRRGVGQMIGGGPESGLYKSTNGGGTWTKLAKGLPPGDVGRIALGVDPKAKPTRVYALINGLGGESGFFRSDDAGVNFERMGAPFGKPGAPENTTSPCDNPAGRRGGGAAAAAPTGAAATTPVVGGTLAPPAGAAGAGRGRGRGAQATPPAGGAGAQAAAQPPAGGAGAAGAAGAPQGAPPAGRGGGRGCAVGAYCGGDPGYYQEIFVDPVRPDTIWSANTNLEWSRDGGHCWSAVPNMGSVHVDFHDVWADPKDRLHIIVGNDGGAYESWDEGKTWRHFDNLPVTQFYRVSVDDALPFYNVCGGAQDNESQCGPSRTVNRVGVRLSDWWMIGGCDGFTSRSEPGNPNIVYTSCQSGGIARLDQRTGENKQIRPGGANVIPNPNDPPAPAAPPDAAGGGAGGRGGGRGGGGGESTNWDAPYIVSSFSPTRLYWASNRVYRSDDRGDHWMAISPNLSRNLDSRVIPIMGKVWDPNTTVAYNNATTPISNVVSLDESPLMEGLIYAGTDDGLLQVTEDGGKTWRKTEKFGSFPEGIYVTSVRASPRDSNVVFVTLNNWQRGDFKPYVLRSDDRGKTFASITGDLPGKMDAWSIIQDHVNSNLLFVGAEFGLFFTVDGGQHWVPLKGGLPTIQVRDLTIQKRENDLVLGTFGRGFYVLDDYSALREVTPEALGREAELFPLRRVFGFDELSYIQAPWGNYTTPNPPNGATFTYSVGSGSAANLVLTIADESGKDLCRMPLAESNGTGVHRVTWNLRVTPPGQGGGRGGGGGGGGGRGNSGIVPCAPISSGAGANAQAPAGPPAGGGFGGRGAAAPMVAFGRYTAKLGRLSGDQVTAIGKAQSFQVVPLPAKNW